MGAIVAVGRGSAVVDGAGESSGGSVAGDTVEGDTVGAMVGTADCWSEAPGDVPATGEGEGTGAAQAVATITRVSASTRTTLTGGMVVEAPG